MASRRCVIKMRTIRVIRLAGALFALAMFPTIAQAQMPPDEHASHHPGQAASPAQGAMSSSGPMGSMGASPAPGAKPGSGMMGEMEKMMSGMHGVPPKEIYPELMSLPEFSPEKREEVQRHAQERMQSGSTLMSEALIALHNATSANDLKAMHDAIARLHEGMARYDSGLAAHRALAEGRAPREVALTWFRREMNLSLGSALPSHRRVTLFHLFTMVLLVAFALAMLALYFFKMRRAAALFGRIEADKGPPPPGSAPELAGGRPPPDDKPPSGGTAPPSNRPPPPGGNPPHGENPPAGEKAPGSSSAAVVADTRSPPPLTANWRGQLRVANIIQETPTVKTLRLVPSANGRLLPFTFVPGQFLNLAFRIGGARMNRSYSISSSPTQREYVDLTVRREPRGAVSRHIDDLLKPGDKIEAGGPVGKFTFDGTEADSIVLLSAGVGITPMMSIARYLTDRSWPGDIFFVHTCRTPADLIFKNELAALQERHPRLHVAVTVSKPEGTVWKGHRGRITKEWLAEIVPDLASRRIHICGPPSMMDATMALLSELGVPPEQVKTESFGTPKPAPAAAGTTAKPTAPADGPLVTFSKNNKSSRIHIDQTILELSEELGIGIQFSCRVGTCGVCKVKMTSGEVDMAVQDALDDDDKASGIILACQAKPKGAVTVEA